LLRRTTFGPTVREISESATLGLEGTLDRLFEEQALPDPPINHINENDPYVTLGETWINAPYSSEVNLRNYRIQSLQSWTLGTLLNSGMSLREKMTLFWHNHFVTDRVEVNDPKFQYRYITLLRENAFGNFREIAKKVTIDPSMLRYLNGNQNTRQKPNENYARELLELFTIGKGPLIAPGDYTYYTENDVLEMARVLTGWIITGFNTNDPAATVGSLFRTARHDTGIKSLSHHFGNVTIGDLGEDEYSHLIDLIFEKEACAFYIARKLYRWFVYYTITPEIEELVIEPIARLITENDYNIVPALRALLGSQHFFESCAHGSMIKHPIDFVVSLLRQSEWKAPGDLNMHYRYWRLVFQFTQTMQMEYYSPPGVAGWKAWYQEPAWYQSWINSVTLPIRSDFIKTMANSGLKVGNNPSSPLPLLEWISALDHPEQPESLIDELTIQLFPRPVSVQKKESLKTLLMQGLADHVWTYEYNNYLADPQNTEVSTALTNKLRNLLLTMFQMPEYQLS
jgi:uncharacterized protein (DUF1800 family)